jgi:hypothetical protein
MSTPATTRAYETDTPGFGLEPRRMEPIWISVPTASAWPSTLCVEIAQEQLSPRGWLGAVFEHGIRRTQGPIADQYRGVLIGLAENIGVVQQLDAQAEHAPLSTVIENLRSRSGLRAADVARMVGIQRRQLYNILDGAGTTPDREQRIRSLASVVDDLFEQFGDSPSVRSALLTPLTADLESFFDIASEGGPIPDAGRRVRHYYASTGRPPRTYIAPPKQVRASGRIAANAIGEVRDISPEGSG